MSFSVRINLENKKISLCPKVTLLSFTWDSRTKDKGFLHYRVKGEFGTRVSRLRIISNAGRNTIIAEDKIAGLPKSIPNYMAKARLIFACIENELSKLSETLASNGIVHEPELASEFFF